MNLRAAFTLIELLVVIAIIAILAVVVVLTLNPAQLLAQSRDANRVSDMATLNSALGLYATDQSGASSFFLGTSTAMYISVPDASSTCGDLGFSALPASYSYACSPAANYRTASSSGWIPVNFQAISSGAPFGSLPVDPVNQTSSGLYYSYVTTGSQQYQLIANMESQKYQTSVTGPLGNGIDVIGSNPGANPIGEWPLNEGTGTLANDLTGANSASWSGTPAGTSGNYSPGLISPWAGAFATSSGDFISVPDTSGILNLSQPFTLTAWIYQSGGANLGIAGDSGNWQLCGYNLIVTGNTAQFDVNYSGVGVFPAAVISSNHWTYLAGVFDGTRAILYANGALVSSSTISQVAACGTKTFYVGNVTQAPYGTFTGLIDDVRVYNRALLPVEVQKIYNVQK